MSVLPHRFLFRYSVPVCHVARLPKTGRQLLDLPQECALPDWGTLDGQESIGRIHAAWNDAGVGFSVQVGGKKAPLVADPNDPESADGLQVWIDTRNTQTIHQASRFCHHFCLLPAGAGSKSDKPLAIQLPIARAREDAPLAKSAEIPIAVKLKKGGYQLEAWLPADVLQGFDAEANPRLGFYYLLHDSEKGEQYLNVGREFPFAHDPSLWSTLELVR